MHPWNLYAAKGLPSVSLSFFSASSDLMPFWCSLSRVSGAELVGNQLHILFSFTCFLNFYIIMLQAKKLWGKKRKKRKGIGVGTFKDKFSITFFLFRFPFPSAFHLTALYILTFTWLYSKFKWFYAIAKQIWRRRKHWSISVDFPKLAVIMIKVTSPSLEQRNAAISSTTVRFRFEVCLV